jgi:hypothetical protein
MVHCTQIRFYQKSELPISVQKLLFTSRPGAQQHSTVFFFTLEKMQCVPVFTLHILKDLEIPTLKTCTVTHNAQNSFGTRLIKK